MRVSVVMGSPRFDVVWRDGAETHIDLAREPLARGLTGPGRLGRYGWERGST
jgi:hypothetical protein